MNTALMLQRTRSFFSLLNYYQWAKFLISFKLICLLFFYHKINCSLISDNLIIFFCKFFCDLIITSDIFQFHPNIQTNQSMV